MCRLITNLFVAVLTFAVGIVASMFFGSVLTRSLEKTESHSVAVSQAPVKQPVPVPLRRNCSCSQSEVETISTDTDYASETRAPISGGILNGKALSLPQPAYPAIARAAHAQGTVNVQIVIDERGCVESARTVGGHPLLQSAAAQAALQACFSPTRLSGQPVKVTGVITYNFVAQ